MTQPTRTLSGTPTDTPSDTPTQARTGVWSGPPGLAALGVLAVMVVWRAVLFGGSFFNQDDYVLTSRAYDTPLTWAFLIRDTAGHVNPAQQLTYWLVAHGVPFDWNAIAAFVLVMQTLACVVMWHLLTRLLPGRWVRVPLLAAFAWSPLTLVTSMWWSAAMGLWPHLICSLLALLFLVRRLQGAGRAWVCYLVCLLASVMGLLWHERAILIAPVLFGASVVLVDSTGWRRLPAALRSCWPLWLSYVVLLPAYLVAHQSLTSVEGGGSSVRTSLSIAWAFFAENVLPGVASGPWSADLEGGAVVPPLWVTVLSLVLAAAVVVVVLRCGGPGRRWAVALFVGYVVADLALVLAGRGGFGRLIGLDPRYSSDVLHMAVVALALALRDSPPGFGVTLPSSVSWKRARTVVLAAGTAAYLVGAAFGSATLVPHFQNPADRTYIGHLRADLAEDPNQVIFDALVPSEIVLPLVGEDSLLSRVLVPLPESPVFDQPSSRMRTVAADGHLVPVVLGGSIPARPGPVPSCGYAVSNSRKAVPLEAPVRGRLLVRLSYFTDQEATVDVAAGEWTGVFQAEPGPNDMWLVLPDQGAEQIRTITLAVEGGTTVCFTGLEAGLPAAPESP